MSRIGIHTTEHYIAKELLTSQYDRSGATDCLCADYISSEATLVITDAQGIDCMEELEIITDGEIKNICKFSRRPGGINTITNIANLGI